MWEPRGHADMYGCLVTPPVSRRSGRAGPPEVEGSAHITGRHEFFIDPDDPLKEGFLLRTTHA
jgi:proline racemase